MSKFGIFKRQNRYSKGEHYIVKQKLFGFIPIFVNCFPDGILAWEDFCTEEIEPTRFDSIEQAKEAIDLFKRSEAQETLSEVLVEEI